MLQLAAPVGVVAQAERSAWDWLAVCRVLADDQPANSPPARLTGSSGPPPLAITADARAIRPWVHVIDEPAFAALNDRLWVRLGLYTGVLLVLLLVALALACWQRTPPAYAYVVFVAASLVFPRQYVGLGLAWLPFSPGPADAALVRGLSIRWWRPAWT